MPGSTSREGPRSSTPWFACSADLDIAFVRHERKRDPLSRRASRCHVGGPKGVATTKTPLTHDTVAMAGLCCLDGRQYVPHRRSDAGDGTARRPEPVADGGEHPRAQPDSAAGATRNPPDVH